MWKRGKWKQWIAAVSVCALLFAAAGCGSAAEGDEIAIVDGNCRTLVTVQSGDTVADLLARAEITLSEEDTVVPGLEETVDDTVDTITISRYAAVTVWEDEQATEVELVGGTVEEAIAIAGVTLGGYDVTNHQLAAYLTDGMEITVEHWYEVTLIVSGAESTVVTDAQTVGELLDEQQIQLDEDDLVSESEDTALADGMTITVEYVSTALVLETEEIAYETVEQESDDLYIGETKVAQEGKNGVRTYTWEVTYVEGAEESRQLVQVEVTEEPVDEIILIGTKEETTTTKSSATTTQKSTESGDPTPKSIPDGTSYWNFQEDCDNSGNGWFTFYAEDGSVIGYEDYWAN